MKNLSTGENIIGDVFIHPTATVDSGAKLGPNVTIGAGAIVEKGTRIKNAIVLEDCHIQGIQTSQAYNKSFRTHLDNGLCDWLEFRNRQMVPD
jgi:carbonic anhydrase/acetyltransferase-like protein (isoleucine patch superfamily)